jgi:hypothetical protein
MPSWASISPEGHPLLIPLVSFVVLFACTTAPLMITEKEGFSTKMSTHISISSPTALLRF